jgi:hypothetical protein
MWQHWKLFHNSSFKTVSNCGSITALSA